MTILGTALPAANTLATLYEVPAGYRAVVNLGVCNRGTTATVRVAVSASATPAESEFIEFDTKLVANDVLERTALSMAAGQKLFISANSANVAFNAWGIEEVA